RRDSGSSDDETERRRRDAAEPAGEDARVPGNAGVPPAGRVGVSPTQRASAMRRARPYNARMPLDASTRLGPYEVVDLIGAGGMGEVYRAIDTRLGRFVAIKVLIPDLVSSDETFERFTAEAKAIAALSHPNILAIFELDHDADRAFIVTELLIGEPLRHRLAAAAIPWTKTAEIGASVCDGLAAAHAKQIIHRDIKPENLFLCADGQVK